MATANPIGGGPTHGQTLSISKIDHQTYTVLLYDFTFYGPFGYQRSVNIPRQDVLAVLEHLIFPGAGQQGASITFSPAVQPDVYVTEDWSLPEESLYEWRYSPGSNRMSRYRDIETCVMSRRDLFARLGDDVTAIRVGHLIQIKVSGPYSDFSSSALLSTNQKSRALFLPGPSTPVPGAQFFLARSILNHRLIGKSVV